MNLLRYKYIYDVASPFSWIHIPVRGFKKGFSEYAVLIPDHTLCSILRFRCSVLCIMSTALQPIYFLRPNRCVRTVNKSLVQILADLLFSGLFDRLSFRYLLTNCLNYCQHLKENEMLKRKCT